MSTTSATARARGRARDSSDGAPVLGGPPQHPGNNFPGNFPGKNAPATLSELLQVNQESTPTCTYLGPQKSLPHWQALGADKLLLTAIAQGVRAPLHSVPKPLPPRTLHYPFGPQTTTTIGEYLATNVVRELTPEEVRRTQYWVPTFPRPKKEAGKIRLITDLRALNACHQVPKHRAETWQTLLSTLQDSSLQWGCLWTSRDFFTTSSFTPRCKGG